MNLTKNFSLLELTKSQTAERKGIDNTPSTEHQENLKKLCENVRMQCGKVTAIIEKDEYSEKMRIVKILKDKYDSSGYTK